MMAYLEKAAPVLAALLVGLFVVFAMRRSAAQQRQGFLAVVAFVASIAFTAVAKEYFVLSVGMAVALASVLTIVLVSIALWLAKSQKGSASP